MVAMDYWPQIIGGATGIIGAAVGAGFATFSSWRDRKHRKVATLLQKLEDLTAALRETVEWRERFEATTAFEDSTTTHPAIVFSQLESLALLYFPRLQSPVAEYTKGLRSYSSWALRHLLDSDLQPSGLPPQSLVARLRVFDQRALENQYSNLLNLHEELAGAIGREASSLLGRS
jgi:hypothetical protein